jgi:hypothetical protein
MTEHTLKTPRPENRILVAFDFLSNTPVRVTFAPMACNHYLTVAEAKFLRSQLGVAIKILKG